MTDAPIMFRYEGDGSFSPASQFWAARADKAFVVGEVYRIVEHHDRSASSHRHFFACVHAAWQNLPDELVEIYPTAEHLRKKALIRKGYRDEREYVCATKSAALDLVRTIRPLDDYAIIEARENVVRIWTAKSQSVPAMGAKAFQESKQDVLDFLDDLLGVERGATAKSEAA
ncbi:MAG: hypothetical protein EOS71_00355 [Mesorhizobium sp.]|nr:MAG: hypothetical protein EOS71_00355 [Mesorhizobium sp.]